MKVQRQTDGDNSAFPEQKSLRVLLVSPLPPPSGGIGRWTVLLLDWVQHQQDLEVRVVDISTRWRAVDEMELWKRFFGGAIQGIRDGWRALVELIRFRPHVLHLNTSGRLRGPWDTALLAMSVVLRVRSVYHIRMGRLPEVMTHKGWEWRGLCGALKLADQIVVLDEESENALKRYVPKERVTRMPNAIAVSSSVVSYGVSHEQIALYLGYVVPTKGMKELMSAWRELCPRDWRLQLGGLGSLAYQKELQEIAGENAEVEFLGDLSPEAAWRRMLSADIFVLPTYTEGFPNVILEAMAAGKAILSTRVGAIPEMLDADGNEPCGLVVNPRDEEALVAALRKLLSEPELRQNLGRRAQAKARRAYTTDIVFDRLVRLWANLAGLTAAGKQTNVISVT